MFRIVLGGNAFGAFGIANFNLGDIGSSSESSMGLDDSDDDDSDSDDDSSMSSDSSSASSISTTWTENDEDRDCSLHDCVCCQDDSIDERYDKWPTSAVDEFNCKNGAVGASDGVYRDAAPDAGWRLVLDAQFPYERNRNPEINHGVDRVQELLLKFVDRPQLRRLAIKVSAGRDNDSPHIMELLRSDPEREWKAISFQGTRGHSAGMIDPDTSAYMEEILDSVEDVESLNIVGTTTDIRTLCGPISRLPNLHTIRFERPANMLSRMTDFTHAAERMSRLTRISFADCQFENIEPQFMELACGISRIKQLVTLKLCRCGVDDRILCVLVQSLKALPNLKNLHLGHNECTSNTSIEAIASLLSTKRTKLVSLNVSKLWEKVEFGDHGMSYRIDRNGNVRFIDYEQLNFDPIFNALANNKHSKLQKLYLAENPLKDSAIQSLASAVRANPTLNSIDLRGVSLSCEMEKELLEAVAAGRTVQRLRLRGGHHLASFYPHLNWAGCRLLANATAVPLALWPFILARVNERTNEKHHCTKNVPAVLYQLLRCPNGESSVEPLLVSIAMQQGKIPPSESRAAADEPVLEGVSSVVEKRQSLPREAKRKRGSSQPSGKLSSSPRRRRS